MKKKPVIQETLVAIRLSSSRKQYIPSNRYITWVDGKWYESGYTQMSIFPESQLPVIKQQLQKHFINFAGFIYPDGHEESWSSFADRVNKKPKFQPKKINGFSFIFKPKQA